MNIKKIFFLLLCFSITGMFGQNFSKKYFANTKWFSNNKDSTFYYTDTLQFIKYSNLAPYFGKKDYSESEAKYLKHGDFVKITFYRHKMDFIEIFHNDLACVTGGKWTWKFYKKRSLLSIYFNRKISFVFKPISEKSIIIEPRLAGQEEKLNTTLLTLVRVKQ